MLKSITPLVFIDLNEGIGKNSKKPYRMVKLANPLTYENFTLNCDPNKQFVNFNSGEKVLVTCDIKDFYGNTNLLVTDIAPTVK